MTIREQTEWGETQKNGYNTLSNVEEKELYYKIMNSKIEDSKKINYYGNGKSADQISDIILKSSGGK